MHAGTMFKSIRTFIFHSVIWLGALACILVWLEIKPKDVWGLRVSLTAPHWIWLAMAILLFIIGILTSGYALFGSLSMQQTGVVVPTPPQSKLVIHSANYAAIDGGGTKYDVSEFMRQVAVVRDSLVLDVENHNFVCNGKNFVPQDPKFGIEKRLQVRYSYDNESPLTIERREHSRLVLPQDSDIVRLQQDLARCQAEYATDRTNLLSEKADAENRILRIEAEKKTLLNRLTVLVHDVLTFLRDQGPAPKVEFKEMTSEKGKRYLEDTEKRIHKIHSGFSLRLHPEIEKLTLEVGEKGIFDYKLAALTQNPVHGEEDIRTIGDKLMVLRDRLEKIEYGGSNEGT
jgi:hypothetical protein